MSSDVSPGSVLEAPAMSQDHLSRANVDASPEFVQGEAEFETVADRLMEELFTDVERMLERGVDLSDKQPDKQPDATAKHLDEENLSSPDSSESTESTSLILAPRLTPRPSILEQAESEEELADLAELMAEIQEDATPHQPTKSFDKLLLGLVLASLTATGGLGWYFRDHLPTLMPSSPVAVAPAQPVDLQQKQTEDFLKYVGRSLDRIERDAKQQREAAAVAAAVVPSPSPSPATVLERVYVPIPQVPQGAAPQSAVPAAPPASFQVIPPAIPQSPTLPAAPGGTAAATAPNIAAVTHHVLIGVLELGDRSAALFDVDGIPQRIQIGEAIGASGWTLVSVQNQEAIVRRNGEVRSIYVGQKF
jgi:hypothetical protein